MARTPATARPSLASTSSANPATRASVAAVLVPVSAANFGNRHNLGCASNEKNAAGHIWDTRDANGQIGATACIIVPCSADRFREPCDWQRLAWWIHDHLPYRSRYFFPKFWAFNLRWREKPVRRIDSWIQPKGCLTKPGMPNHGGSHADIYRDLPVFDSALGAPDAVLAYGSAGTRGSG